MLCNNAQSNSSTYFLANILASGSASEIPLFILSCKISLCFSSAWVGHVWSNCWINSQQYLLISLDLLETFDVIIGINRALYVFWMMNLMHTEPEVDIIFTELGIRLMMFCIRASRNRSTRWRNCCDMYPMVIHASRTTYEIISLI